MFVNFFIFTSEIVELHCHDNKAMSVNTWTARTLSRHRLSYCRGTTECSLVNLTNINGIGGLSGKLRYAVKNYSWLAYRSFCKSTTNKS